MRTSEGGVDGGERVDLQGAYAEGRAAVEDLKARTAEVLELTKRIEELAAGTPARYPDMKTRIEAGAMARQVRDLLQVLEELGEKIGSPARGDADRWREPEELRLEREIEDRRERLAGLRRRTLVRELDRHGHDTER